MNRDLPSLRWMSVLAVVLLGAPGCKRDEPTLDPEQRNTPGMAPGEHLLFQPVGNPEALLGREVTRSEQGHFVLAEARAPGCEVAVRHEPSQWHRTFSQDLGHVAALSIGREELGGLMAKFDRGARLEAEVSNTEVLRADLRGPCGQQVVKSVKVGTGHREVLQRVERGASVGANVKGVPLGAKGAHWKKVGGSLTWTKPQAWAFEVGEGQSADAARIAVRMPLKIRDGQRVTPIIEVTQPMWLIVLYRDANGDYGLLWPSPSRAQVRAEPKQALSLPQMRAVALPQGTTHEKLIVYGLLEKGDYDLVEPPAGSLTADEVRTYAERTLPDKLEAIPRQRWTTTTFGYVIETSAPAP